MMPGSKNLCKRTCKFCFYTKEYQEHTMEGQKTKNRCMLSCSNCKFEVDMNSHKMIPAEDEEVLKKIKDKGDITSEP